MKYIVLVLLSMLSVYMYSFGKYNWQNNNKIAAAGIALLTLTSIIIPVMVVFFNL